MTFAGARCGSTEASSVITSARARVRVHLGSVSFRKVRFLIFIASSMIEALKRSAIPCCGNECSTTHRERRRHGEAWEDRGSSSSSGCVGDLGKGAEGAVGHIQPWQRDLGNDEGHDDERELLLALCHLKEQHRDGGCEAKSSAEERRCLAGCLLGLPTSVYIPLQ